MKSNTGHNKQLEIGIEIEIVEIEIEEIVVLELVLLLVEDQIQIILEKYHRTVEDPGAPILGQMI